MKTFLEFLYEAEGAGQHAGEIATLRRQAQEAMRKGDMTRYAELAKELKELQSAESLGRHLRGDNETTSQSNLPTWSSSKPAQSPKDPITGAQADKERGTIGTLPNVARKGTVTQGEVVGGIHGGLRRRSNSGGRSNLGNTGVSSSGGQFGIKGPY